MSFDALSARLEQLKKSDPVVAALDAIRQLRLTVAQDVRPEDLASAQLQELAVRLYRDGRRPFQHPDFISALNWKRVSQVLQTLLAELREAGVADGSLDALLRDLRRSVELSQHLCRASMDTDSHPLELLASKYGVEPDLLRVLATTPLHALFNHLHQKLPVTGPAVSARNCLLCGSPFSLGLYRGGMRFLLCSTCGRRVHVDFFFCAHCGSTDPHTQGFVKPSGEAALQVEYCRRCGSYIKTFNEDVSAVTVSDPVLLDLATVDLDPIGREAAQRREGPSSS